MAPANRFYVVPPGERRAAELHPPEPEPLAAPSQRYFVEAFAALPPLGLTFFLTWDLDVLPRYGGDVVALVLADEAARRPRYVGRVRRVFKCYGDRPRFTWPPVGAAVAAQELRRWVEALPDVRHRGPEVVPLPLGYHNQVDLPVRPVEERSTFAFFAGSVEEPHRRRLPSAKTRSRQRMVQAARAWTGGRVRLATTASFGASSEADPVAYSEALMDSVVCLCPRGGSVETFRWFEAMRAGCVVVCEPLPRFWFYRGSPAIEVRDWSAFPALLDRLRDDPAQVRQRHEAALAWWRDVSGPDPLARRMAETLR